MKFLSNLFRRNKAKKTIYQEISDIRERFQELAKRIHAEGVHVNRHEVENETLAIHANVVNLMHDLKIRLESEVHCRCESKRRPGRPRKRQAAGGNAAKKQEKQQE